MGVLTAKEMAALEKARQNVKKETYKALLDQFSRKIRTSHDLGLKSALLTVPPFVVGFPRYDLPKAVRYLARQLQKLGYAVDLAGPVSFRVAGTADLARLRRNPPRMRPPWTSFLAS